MDSLTPASTRQIANISCSAIYPNNNNDNNNIKSSSALSRKDYPLRPGLSSLGSKSFDSNQAVVEGNEADTETTSTIRHRKRRNSTTLRSTHQSAIKKVTSPATSSTRQVHLRPSTSGGLHSPASNFSSVAQSPSYSAFKPSRNNESRSPPVRRPPASRSSHGVATSAGPPPAISTQRVFSFESLRLPIGDESAEPTRLTPKALAELDATSRVDQDLKQVISTDYIQPSRGRSTQPKPIETQSGKAIELKSNTETEFRMDRTNKRYSVDGGRTAIQRSNAQPNYNHMALQDSLSNGSSHEDLFLNMAQVVGAVEWEQEPKVCASSKRIWFIVNKKLSPELRSHRIVHPSPKPRMQNKGRLHRMEGDPV